MRSQFVWLWLFCKAHKILTGIAILIILGGCYWGYVKYFGPTTPTRYMIGTVTRGDLVSKVKGTGQISADNQVDLKPQGSTQSSLKITRITVNQGDSVSTGDLIAVVDNHSSLVSLHQAQSSVESSQASYDKIVNGATSQNINVSSATLASAQLALTNSKQNLLNKINNAYNDAFSVVYTYTNPLFLNPSSTNPQYGAFGSSQVSGAGSANSGLVISITAERVALNTMLPSWNSSIGNTTPTQDLMVLTTSTSDHLNYTLQYLNDILSDLTTYEISNASASSYITSTNNARGIITGDISNILSAQQSVSNAQSQLSQSESSLALTKAPARPEDIATAKAQLDNAKSSLESAQYNYDQSFLRAPFDGVVAQVNVSEGDLANAATVVASIITRQQIAEISLNELDAAQVHVGATTTLTFDALPDVTLVGRVAQIDTLGTVTQGVVSYKAKISFATSSTLIKPGMSVSASIVTGVEHNVLLVPSSAIKTAGNKSSIQIPSTSDSIVTPSTKSATPDTVSSTTLSSVTLTSTPKSVPVEIGNSDNTMTIITAGLTEGQKIYSRQVSGATIKAQGGLFSPPKG